MKYQAQIGDNTYRIELVDERTLIVNGEKVHYDLSRADKSELISLILNGRSYQAWVESDDPRSDGVSPVYKVHLAGVDYQVTVDDERSLKLKEFSAAAGSVEEIGQVVAPMPGLVVKVLVSEGEAVKKGDGVVIVEAMKMENEIRAPLSGTVKEIRVMNRQAVEKGELLAVIG